MSPTESSSGLPVPASAGSLAGVFTAARLTLPAATIGPGELDTPGFPRDAYGRALLVTCVAMAADLLVPWIDQSGQQSISPTRAGLPILAVAAVLGLAMVPLIRPSFRARPPLAAVPIVVGGMFLSLSLVTWGLVTYISIQMSLQQQRFASDGSAIRSGPPVISPGVGIYLFILGSVVLIVSGYQVFLQTARRSAPPQPATITAPEPLAAMPPTTTPERLAEPPASDTAASPQDAPAQAQEAALPASTDGGDAGIAPRVVLPGSASWHEEPKLPAYSRPSPLGGGWSRQPRPLR